MCPRFDITIASPLVRGPGPSVECGEATGKKAFIVLGRAGEDSDREQRQRNQRYCRERESKDRGIRGTVESERAREQERDHALAQTGCGMFGGAS